MTIDLAKRISQPIQNRLFDRNNRGGAGVACPVTVDPDTHDKCEAQGRGYPNRPVNVSHMVISPDEDGP